MNEIVSKLNNEDILALCGIFVGMVAVLGGVAIAITGVISTNRRKAQRDEIEGSLKMSMIERGMSAGEIKQILEARMDAHQCVQLGALLESLKPPAAPQVYATRPDKA